MCHTQSESRRMELHVLKPLLPTQTQHSYDLRDTSQLCINWKELTQINHRHFIIRQLYKYSYWLYVWFLLCFVWSCVLSTFIKRILYCIVLYWYFSCSQWLILVVVQKRIIADTDMAISSVTADTYSHTLTLESHELCRLLIQTMYLLESITNSCSDWQLTGGHYMSLCMHWL